MIPLQPKHRRTYKKRSYFISVVVEDGTSPLGMIALPWVFMLIKTTSVKVHKPMPVHHKMRRYPIQNNADAGFMHNIYKLHKLVRISVAGCGSKISAYLIPP